MLKDSKKYITIMNHSIEAERTRQYNLVDLIQNQLTHTGLVEIAGKVESTQEVNIRGVMRSIPRTDIICGLYDPCYDPGSLGDKLKEVFNPLREITRRAQLSKAAKDAIEPFPETRSHKLVTLVRGNKDKIQKIVAVSVYPDTGIAQAVLEGRLLKEAGVLDENI
jgi:hypothetical protein